MTMDIQSVFDNYRETPPYTKDITIAMESAKMTQTMKSASHSTVLNPTTTSKRSFDVAFLMMPDEKLKQKQPEKQLRVSKQLFNSTEWEQPKGNPEVEDCNDKMGEQDVERTRAHSNASPSHGSDNIDVGTDEFPTRLAYSSDSDVSDRSTSRPNSNESAAKLPKFLPEYKNKIFDDPTLISMQSRVRYENKYSERTSPKSAFTKVSNFNLRSPNPSVSPDNLLYQNSISPPLSVSAGSPGFSKGPAFNGLLSPAQLLNGEHYFKNQQCLPPSSPNYPDSTSQRSVPPFAKSIDFSNKQADPKQISPNKMNFLPFRPEIPYLQAGSAYPFGVQNFQATNCELMKFPVGAREQVSPLLGSPAAAILSTLLPPTLAAFSLPAQNVCAKCSISFRMTSDLVYHMRTHHKSEAMGDPHRRKREEKLKCPVCNESFRERHHLTRHMTAHQDKEGDMDDLSPAQHYHKKNKQFYHASGSLVHK